MKRESTKPEVFKQLDRLNSAISKEKQCEAINRLYILNSAVSNSKSEPKGIKQSNGLMSTISKDKPRSHSDECYIIDLCDEVLNQKAIRQHRFDFLRGDTGAKLPVDAYYPSLNLVVEFKERQHSEEVKFFNRRETVSGVTRGEQRRKYDQFRRDILPENGIRLIEFDYSEFKHNGSKKLLRSKSEDLKVIKWKLI